VRILVLVEHLGPVGGAERSLVEEAEALSARGHEFVISYRVADSFVPRYEAIGATLVPTTWTMSRWHPLRSLLGMARAVRPLCTTDPDVVYCNFLYTLPLCLWVARRLSIPVVAAIREPLVGGLRRRLYRRLLRRVATAAFMSEEQRSDYERANMVPARAPVIRNGIDAAYFRLPSAAERDAARGTLALEPEALAVLYLGRLDPAKGVDTLLEALARLDDARVVGLIAGGGSPWLRRPEAYPDRLAASAPDGVRFLGRRDDPRALLWAADVVAVPSRWAEPLARSVLESMACGVPVVASRVGGLPEMFPGRLAELLFAPGDAEGLVGALRQALPELGGHRGWAELTTQNVAAGFSLERTVDALEDLLAASIAGPGRATAGWSARRAHVLDAGERP
jgi:glycosyltransferase involved in cell wall biosynthesis